MKNVILGLAIIYSIQSSAQELSAFTSSFTNKIDANITLLDGTNIVGKITDIDKKSGLMKSLRVKDATGKKKTVKMDEVATMYAPPYKMKELSGDQWIHPDMNKDLVNQGMAYFELIEIKTRNKTKPLVAQVLNTDFSAKVKIYYDPWNGASIMSSSGVAKSYYIKKEGDDLAYEFNAKKYAEESSSYWNCEKVGDTNWDNLLQHAMTYSENCN